MDGRTLRLGDSRLIETDDPVGLAAGLRALTRSRPVDAVPGDGTLLVRGGGPLPDELPHVAVPGHEHVVPVVYDGADLESFGLPADEVVARHTAVPYRVAFLGFSPGFAYLDGLDPALHLPRLDAPRPSVPALSVAVAGARTCIYPTASPGGWRLLGRAVGITPFRPDADPPALFAPGDTVRFVAVRDRVETTATRPARPPVRDGVRVLDGGPQTVVVARPRVGYAHLGVPWSGALDPRCWHRANLLVGNEGEVPALEAVFRGPHLDLGGRRAAIVWPGGERVVTDGDLRRLPAWRCWIGLEGGIRVDPVLGSATSDTLGGLGPPPLRPGDGLPVRGEDGQRSDKAAFTATHPVEAPAAELVLALEPGPDAHLLERACGTWTVDPRSDRTALRLAGDASPHDAPTRTVGLVPGAVQLPPGGQPVVFLAGHPTTGGYPLVGWVRDHRALFEAAQLRPGRTVTLLGDS
ncbi:MAG TPA: carboxyltransferase domain-containing protein [Mycobacteriales bacterium]|nr:carboxyltransferase domain-containing protein [Mycobacteriales bacterium]